MSTNALAFEGVHQAAAGYVIPVWAIPIILVVGLAAMWYRKNRDGDR